MRVVFAAMIDLRLPDCRRLILLSRTRWTSRRERFYSPFGGAIQAKPDGRHALQARFDLMWEGTGEDADAFASTCPPVMRRLLSKPCSTCPDDQREHADGAWRELIEELVDEHGLLEHEDVLHGVGALKRIGTYRTESVSNNPELARPSRTRYVFETYAACARGRAAAKLEHALTKGNPPTLSRWLTAMTSRKMLGPLTVAPDVDAMFIPMELQGRVIRLHAIHRCSSRQNHSSMQGLGLPLSVRHAP